MARTVTIGVQGVATLRDGGAFYVDQTGFIRDGCAPHDDVTLISRPRRGLPGHIREPHHQIRHRLQRHGMSGGLSVNSSLADFQRTDTGEMCLRPHPTALAFCLVPVEPASAYMLTEKVIHVADDDSITVLTASYEKGAVRFYGIHAPEKKQVFGARSKQLAVRLAKGQIVNVDEVDHRHFLCNHTKKGWQCQSLPTRMVGNKDKDGEGKKTDHPHMLPQTGKKYQPVLFSIQFLLYGIENKKGRGMNAS